MTLKELLKDKQLPVKVTRLNWHCSSYFEVTSFRKYGATGYIQDDTPYSSIFSELDDGWELYQEPKQKTVLSEYIIKIASNGFTSYYFKSDEDFLTQFNGPIIKTGRTIEVELS